MEDNMEENTNKVVVIDVDGNATTAKTEEEIKNENDAFEQLLKEKKMRPKKSQAEDDMPIMLEKQTDRSVNLGVIGVGQCGSKIAEEFYTRGYNAVAINTASQDLKCINIPEQQKLFLNYALGGAAKDLETGRAAAEEYAESISNTLKVNFIDSSILLLAIAGGGGTGSGSAEMMVELMAQLGKPIAVLYVLPLVTEDALSKHNAIQT